LNEAIQDEDPDSLGNRVIDQGADWTPHINTHHSFDPDPHDKDWWQMIKDANPADLDVLTMSTNQKQQLNRHQLLLYNTVIDHYQHWLSNGQDNGQLMINLDGRAGTGKTFVITMISSHLQSMQRLQGHPKSPVLRLAPFGSASYGVQGQTLHSLLRLPISVVMSLLPAAQLATLITALRGVHYLIIDEKSMLGLRTLSRIDQRLRQVFPERKNECFGSMNVILCGDFY
jgi:hypothetical protein